jgi:hypothetical protein
MLHLNVWLVRPYIVALAKHIKFADMHRVSAPTAALCTPASTIQTTARDKITYHTSREMPMTGMSLQASLLCF